MRITPLADAKPYQAPNHRDCTALRLSGAEAGGATGFAAGLSHFLPGGGAGPDASPVEKLYFVLSGRLTVITDDGEAEIGPQDTCFLAANEKREIINRGNDVVTMLVVVAKPA